MPVDMKEIIADSAWHLVLDKRVKKLTVKDIVEDCHITRQTFYYHFEDIPALFRWIIEQNGKKIMQQAVAQPDAESGMKDFFLVAINAGPYLKQGMQTSYRQEFEEILFTYGCLFFTKMAEKEKLYQNCPRAEADFIVRYHCRAIIGMLQNWSDEDTKNLDEIVHRTWQIIQRTAAQ